LSEIFAVDSPSIRRRNCHPIEYVHGSDGLLKGDPAKAAEEILCKNNRVEFAESIYGCLQSCAVVRQVWLQGADLRGAK
jgi:hypothetical protein